MDRTSLKDFFRNKWVRVVLIADTLVVVALIILSVVNATKTATLVLDIVPIDATVTLNGSGNYSNGTYQIYPGTYKVAISHDGLDTKTFDVDVKNGENASITTYLTKDGDISYYKQKSSRSDFDRLRNMISSGNTTTDQDASADEMVQQLYGDSIMMSSLPINDVYYENTDTGRHLVHDVTIRAGSTDCETWLCIEALMLGTDDQELIQNLLRSQRFNVEDYEIKYKVY